MAAATLSPSNNIHPSFSTHDTYNPGAGIVEPPTQTATQTAHAITHPPPSLHALFNYYLPAADGSPPAPSYVDRPETRYRPANPQVMPVRDIRGNEEKYTLDTTGFQVIKHVSVERDFLDEEQIKRVYYPEVEEVLKAVWVVSGFFFLMNEC